MGYGQWLYKITMLQKDRISGIKIFSDEWQSARLGKFTSSRIHNLVADKPYSKGFMSYVYQKVGEELTGKPIYENEPETDAMQWGLEYEPVALQKFGKVKGLDFLVVQQLIIVPETRFMGTPDALLIHNESVDQSAYNVATVEVKCFPSFQSYVTLALCRTPEDIKKAFPYVYWQIVDQMDICDCLVGYCVAYHPHFKAGNLNIVEFRKVNMIEDVKFLKERKQMATEKFEEIRDKMIQLGAV
jgi:hypothetical protein